VIPPRSVVECVAYDRRTAAYKNDLGQRYRIGYYGACRDGVAVAWLVDALGEYVARTDHDDLPKHFRIIRRSGETDYYGDDRRPLRALPGARALAVSRSRRATRATGKPRAKR
jgi:hypothetical protein